MFEILSCGTMVSAYLSEAGHEASLDRLEPPRWSKSEKSQCLANMGEGEEFAFWVENLFVFVFEVVEEFMPFSECLCLNIG